MKQNRLVTRWWHQPAVNRVRHALTPSYWYRDCTHQYRALPDFLIAGAMKAGTTSLFGYLQQHPQCSPSMKKEVNYFCRNFSRGMKWYRMHFPRITARTQGSQCFEATPGYIFAPRVPRRVLSELPNVRVVCLLRNPVDRAYSHYQHNVRRGREPLSFAEAIAAEPQRLEGEVERIREVDSYQSHSHFHFSYLARGNYADQLAVWMRHFPADRLLVLQAETLFRQPQQVLDQTHEFLGLDPFSPVTLGNRYPGRYRVAMEGAMRRRLETHYEPHNQRLFRLLGRSFDWTG